MVPEHNAKLWLSGKRTVYGRIAKVSKMTSKTYNRDFVSAIAFCWLCADEIKTTFQAF